MKKNYSVSQFDLGIRLSQNNVNEILATHFGNKFVEYRNIWDRAGRGEISPAFPVDINVEFVDECNQRCTFCARNEKLHPDFGHTLNTGTKLSDHFVDKLVDEAGAHGLYAITLGSGEPLLFRNIFSVVKRLHNVGVIDSRLITNGLLLHKYTDQIFDSGLVHLFTSIGAFSEETYNRDRGYGYQKVVDNMISFLEEKKGATAFCLSQEFHTSRPRIMKVSWNSLSISGLIK